MTMQMEMQSKDASKEMAKLEEVQTGKELGSVAKDGLKEEDKGIQKDS